MGKSYEMNDMEPPAGVAGSMQVGMTMMNADEMNAGVADAPRADQPSSTLLERIGVVKFAERRPEVDECDLCEAALPGSALEDWSSEDKAWIEEHTKTCRYCRNELTHFMAVDKLLDKCGNVGPCPLPKLPVLKHQLPKRRAAYGTIDSPIGELLVAVSDKGVCEIGFAWMDNEKQFAERLSGRGFVAEPDQHQIDMVAIQLQEYFAGERSQFAVPLDFSGLSPFTKAVLDATYEVPFGETRTYREIAERIGSPKATRAVGNALHNNPIPLIVPCHRILPTSTKLKLGGYAGGVETKQRLLSLEGVLPQNPILFS
jgi:methylated-DNA-[protein]-cysteine S-methyltransferase